MNAEKVKIRTEEKIEQVRKDWTIFPYISKSFRTIPVMFAAVQTNWRAIKFIARPNEILQKEAVKQNWEALKFINSPTVAVQKNAVRQSPGALKYIKHPEKSVIKIAVEKSWHSARYLTELQDLRYAVSINPKTIQFIATPSTNLQVTAVKQNPVVIRYLENPSREAQIIAVQKAPELIKFIKKPDVQTEIAAFMKDNACATLIKNPQSQMVKSYLERIERLKVEKSKEKIDDYLARLQISMAKHNR